MLLSKYIWATVSHDAICYGGGMAVGAEPSHQYSVTFCCHVTDGRSGAVWPNYVWHGSVSEAKMWGWIPACRKNCSHWRSWMLAEHFWRPNSGSEHSEMVGGVFQLIHTNQWIKTRKLYVINFIHANNSGVVEIPQNLSQVGLPNAHIETEGAPPEILPRSMEPIRGWRWQFPESCHYWRWDMMPPQSPWSDNMWVPHERKVQDTALSG